MIKPPPKPKKRTLGDFRNFLKKAFPHLGIKREPTELQYYAAHLLQHGPNKLALICFRGFGKSTIAATRGCHVGLCDPERKFLNISAAAGRARKTNKLILQLTKKMPEMHHLYPDAALGDRASGEEFDWRPASPAIQPSVSCLGLDSNNLEGSRATDALCDDIETKKNSQTVASHYKVKETARQVGGAFLRSADEIDNPKVHFLGTPQNEQSMYFEHLEKAGYTVIIIPARYPDPETRRLYKGRLAPILEERLDANPDLAGTPTEPERFSHEELLLREAEYGLHGWLLQFMLLPTLANADRYPLKINHLIAMDLDPEVGPEKVLWTSDADHRLNDVPCVGFDGDHFHSPAKIVGGYAPYTGNVMAIDPSGRGKDELAYSVVKTINSQICLLDLGGFLTGDSEETILELANIAKRYNITRIVVEKNFGGGVWSQLLRPVLRKIHPGCEVEDVSVSGRKEVRTIDILGPVIRSHRLVVNKDAIRKDYDSTQEYEDGTSTSSLDFQLFYQMSRLTSEPKCLAHDDRLDSLALAVADCTDTMSRDYEEEIELREQEALERMVEGWYERTTTLIGSVPEPEDPNWIDI